MPDTQTLNMQDVTVELYTVEATPTLIADFTHQVTNLTLEFSASERVRTTFGRNWVRRGTGIKDGSLSITWLNDYASDGVNAVHKQYFGQEMQWYVTDEDGNEYVFPCIFQTLSPFSGDVDADSSVSITYPLSDEPTLPNYSA